MENFLKNYTVTQDGRVFVKRTGKERKQINRTSAHGRVYKRVDLWCEGVSKNFTVHRLVAFVHIPNPENKPIVDHIDGNRFNNHVTNLRWATSSENQLNRKPKSVKAT